MPEWEVPLFAEPLAVDWRAAGGDWDRYFGHEIRALTGGGNLQGSMPNPVAGDDVRPMIEYRLGKEPAVFRSWLRLFPVRPVGLKAFGVSHEEPPEYELEVWRQAAARATVRSSRGTVPFAWHAVLGSAGWPTHLEEPGTVGAVRVLPGEGVAYVAGRGSFEPIWLEGTTTGSAWTTARLEARQEARLVAALLSVAWDVPVEVQFEPAVEDEGEGRPDLQRIQAWTSEQAWPRRVPSWMRGAPAAVSDDAYLSSALLVHHEGLQLQYAGHHSFAFAAFVAALEAIGARTVDMGERCPQCKVKTGAMNRFRTAVRLVLADGSPEYKQVVFGYGKFRSSTVHTGALHGGEEKAGGSWISGNPFLVATDQLFISRELPQMRSASRRALESLLAAGDG